MTVETGYAALQQVGNGVTTNFPISWPFADPGDLVVSLIVIATGLPIAPAPALNGAGANDYTVTGIPDPDTGIYPNGAVVMNSAPSALYYVLRERGTDDVQDKLLPSNGPLPAKAIEGGLDRRTLRSQEDRARLVRALTVPETLSPFSSAKLPPDFFAGGRVLAWDPVAGAPSTVDPMVNRAEVAASKAEAAAGAALGLAYMFVDTMAALRLIQPAQALAAQNAYLRSYYGTIGDGASGAFFWNATDARTDNGGTIIKPGTLPGASPGRWNRNTGPFAGYLAAWFGVKEDDITDNLVTLQACIDAAFNYGPNVVLFGTTANTIRFSGTLTVYPATTIIGAGKLLTNLRCTAAGYATPAFKIARPAGNLLIAAPRMHKFSLIANFGFQYNTIAGGFLDNPTTQDYLDGAEFQDLYLAPPNFNTNGPIGIQICKAPNAHILRCHFQAFEINLDLEGSDNPAVRDCWFDGANNIHVLAQGRGTFGNGAVLDHNFMISVNNGGAAFIKSSYRSIEIVRNWLEGAGVNTAAVWIDNPTSAFINIQKNWMNFIGASLTNWLKVDDATNGLTGQGINSLSVEYNDGPGLNAGNSVPNFNGSTGMSYFNGAGGLRRRIVHRGNIGPSGDAGFPFNSVESIDAGHLQPGTLARFSPNLDGLSIVAYGATVKCFNGAFVLAVPGAPNYLEFFNQDAVSGVDAGDLWVRASGAGGTINGAILDASFTPSTFGALATFTLPTWFKLKTNVANAKGCRIYATGATVLLWEAAIVKNTYPTS